LDPTTGPWLGAAARGAAIPATVWWFTEVICGCKELSPWFGGSAGMRWQPWEDAGNCWQQLYLMVAARLRPFRSAPSRWFCS
ncbi:unnamed protein product, partial [Prunus brigantina]